MFFLLGVMATAQSTLQVFNSDNHRPLSQVSVFCEDQLLGRTNIAGKLTFQNTCTTITLRKTGFFDERIDVKPEMILTMEPLGRLNLIPAVQLSGKSDREALRVLGEVNRRFKDNSPDNQESYSFKSYDQFSIDLAQDSIKAYQDFVRDHTRELGSISVQETVGSQAKDTARTVDMVKLLTDSQLLFGERVLFYQYLRGAPLHIDILDSRISGLQQPIYELLTRFSNVNKIPSLVRRENWKIYRYKMAPSMVINNRKTFVINFIQIGKTESERQIFHGAIYVDADTFGLVKIDQQSGDFDHLQYEWSLMNGSWFLTNQSFRIRIGETVFRPAEGKVVFGKYATLKEVCYDFKVPDPSVTKQDLKGYTFRVTGDDGKKMSLYRPKPLTDREKNTYIKIDSLSHSEHFQEKVNFLVALTKGSARFGMVDIPLYQLFEINRYEGVRFGLAAKLNENFSRRWSPDAYVAYGIRDKAWKYGFGLDYRTSLTRDAKIRADYTDDVQTSGKFSDDLWYGIMRIKNLGASLATYNFYHFKSWRLSYTDHLTSDFSFMIRGQSAKENALFDYSYRGKTGVFHDSNLTLSLKFAPNEDNVMTPTGKYTVRQGNPSFFLNYEQGLKILDGDFSFARLDFLGNYEFNSFFGRTGLRLYGGVLTGSAPIWKSFEAGGLRPDTSDNLWTHLNLTTYLGFATMPSGKYYQDRFGAFYITHRIPWHFKSFGKNVSSFDVLYKGVTGDFRNPQDHDFSFETLHHLYQEIGVEWNNFLSSQFNLGFFYRVGPYHTGNFGRNFAVQFKLKLLGF